METKNILASCLLSSTVIFGASHVSAQENTNYRYGQLLVQRSQSAWGNPAETQAPPASVYAPAPSVVPSYSERPANPLRPATTYTPLAPTPERKVTPVRPVITHASPNTAAPAPTPSPAQNPMLGAYYMPAPPMNAEPALAPGESLPPAPPAEALLPPPSAEAPSLESQPIEDKDFLVTQSNADTFAKRYVSGPPVPTHPGTIVQSPSGPAFQGPIASDPGFIPSWLKLRFGNAFRVDTVETQRSASEINGQSQTLKEEWDGLSTYELKGGAEYTNRSGMLEGLHLQGQASYGWIISGDADAEIITTTPSPTPGDAPITTSQVASRDGGDGNVSGWKAAIGYDFMPDFIDTMKGRSSFIPMLGYAVAKQELIADFYNGVTSEFRDYETEWSGPFVGLQIDVERPEFNFGFSSSLHWAQFEGEGAVRSSDPASNVRFSEDSDALGFNFSGNFGVVVYDSIDAFMSASFDVWSADGGVTTISSPTANAAVRLDEVTWKSQSYLIGLAYRW